MSKILGIDLGTTNSAMAIVNQYGRPEVVVNREGGRVTPSVVLFEEDSVTVGAAAKNLAAHHPLDTAQFAKRHMGDPDWRFVNSSGQRYSAEEISALILKRLKEDAEAKVGATIHQAVISVPAYFDDARRKATQDAGKIAGLEVLHIFNEPTAAALAYGIDATSAGTVLVYDLGGGTFDVTVMSIQSNEHIVRATGGDPNLGGFDWDNELMSWLNEEFKKAGGPDLLDAPATEQELRNLAEVAKHTLSNRDYAMVHVTSHGFSHRIRVTRDVFDDLSAHLLQRTRHLTEQTLEDAGMGWRGIDRSLLVGGSTRMRQIHELMLRMSGSTPSLELNPDEVVAMGAAIQGELTSPSSQAPTIVNQAGDRIGPLRVQDVTSHSIGITLVDDRVDLRFVRSEADLPLTNSIILKRGTPIPASGATIIGTLTDYQDVYHCEVNEGEDEDINYVRKVGEGFIRLPGTYPAGAPVEVNCQYDRNGIIHIFVRDRVSDQWLGELHIERQSNLSPSEIASKSTAIEATVVE